MENKLVLSSLGHTWILDLDGTVVKHNGYKEYGEDILLDGALDFLKSISDKDMVIFITSRSDNVKQMTEDFLTSKGVHFKLYPCSKNSQIVKYRLKRFYEYCAEQDGQ